MGGQPRSERVPAVASVALVLAACTGSTRVTVELSSDVPSFIKYRDGTSPWQTPAPLPGGTYAAHHFELEVTGDYEVVAVDVDPLGAATSTELFATTNDATHWYFSFGLVVDADDSGAVRRASGQVPCTPPDRPLGSSLVVSGAMVQAGQVSIGDACTSSATPSWSYKLAIDPAAHDVIATDPLGTASPRVAIARDVAIDAATPLPTIDLAASGRPLGSSTVAVTNTGIYPNDAGPISSSLVLYTDGGVATLTSGTDDVASATHTVPVVPASLLAPSDTQLLTVSVTDGANAYREATTSDPTGTGGLELLSPPAATFSAAAGVETAAWNEPASARIDAVDVETSSFVASNPDVTLQAVTATARWLAGRAQDHLAFDTDVPGYEAAWSVDLSQMHETGFTVRAHEGSVDYATSQSSGGQ